MGVNLDILKRINNYLLKTFKVDFTFLNIVSEKNLKIRLKKRKKLNRYDKFRIKFYSNVQKGYLKIAKNKKNYKIIDSNRPIDINQNDILKKIEKLIK